MVSGTGERLLFSRKLFIYGNSSISSVLWFALNHVGVRADVSVELAAFLFRMTLNNIKTVSYSF